ncbi:MAG: hypothetical protein WAN66_05310 [Limnoraphis robusta]|jgi:hypothetical protein|uniref:hypothetical protein n=1 Tax=Limnoraphis robusta TaxID=1118279 RepID=UPI0013649FEE|nr:hypothetical protein [Limnoraphis robusta]
MTLKRLQEFHQNVYNQMGAAADAVFELMDAALLTPNPCFLAELSQACCFL